MKRIKTILIITLLMALAFIILRVGPIRHISPPPLNRNPNLRTPNPIVTPPIDEQDASSNSASVQAQDNHLANPIQDQETEDFFNLVANAETREEVFATPGRHVIATKFGNMWIAQGDLIVSEDTLIDDAEEKSVGIAKLSNTKYWLDNKVPYRIEVGFDASHILRAIEIMNHQTPLRFVEATNESDYVYFAKTDSKRCSSYLGRQGGRQDILVNPQNCKFGNVIHEMMHAIGFGHEHSREDRDDFIEVHWANIAPELHDQFQKLTPDLSPTTGPFDFDSIMLYPSEASARGEYPSMTKRDGSWFDSNRSKLSKGDLEKINAIYAEQSASSS